MTRENPHPDSKPDIPSMPGNPEERSARALEYQAYFLEKIEGHLATIASYMGHGPKFSLMTEVQQIRVALTMKRP